MRYEINQSNEIRVYEDGKEIPFILQAKYPDGTEWTAEQAEAWAQAVILHHVDSELNPFPIGPTQ